MFYNKLTFFLNDVQNVLKICTCFAVFVCELCLRLQCVYRCVCVYVDELNVIVPQCNVTHTYARRHVSRVIHAKPEHARWSIVVVATATEHRAQATVCSLQSVRIGEWVWDGVWGIGVQGMENGCVLYAVWVGIWHSTASQTEAYGSEACIKLLKLGLYLAVSPKQYMLHGAFLQENYH